MPESPLAPHGSTPEELGQRLQAERQGTPFLIFRDGADRQRIVDLGLAGDHLTFGRDVECDVCLSWDPKVSRLHAELQRVRDHWLLIDDGLSSNGTRIFGERVLGRRRLRDADLIELGSTIVAFRAPAAEPATSTVASDQRVTAAAVTDAQLRVLVALCRPYKGGAMDATPATNPQIAAELFLTVAAVKTHLRALSHAFEIHELPQQEKRRRLVTLAFASGAVRDRDL